ncbi:alpha/beta hydrolase [Histidinibacterium aquaticum]|uniref:Alpha/beta hydrolase fold domain-containing protein n=1 Tax=Histidinibacterium aquaticum TaxID=2613962 RepID=A0A5J5GQM8_9RHOB|nr:alpha/beta hydrolase [Histidinibacterium aquaticum]KAA9010490.1 alpha/beta hydrolase fold domain-containing protein [Histidinibacterium aquaticum]
MGPDDAYANAPYIPDGESYPARWAAEAAAFRNRHPPDVVPYGETTRQAFDLFLPEQEPRGLVVFVHGGYWMRFGRGDWSHLAAGPLSEGWAVAMPGYDLCPDVHIRDITRQVARAVTVASERVSGPLRLAGHSAGGHLVARMCCSDVSLTERGRIERILPISPVSDLEPLRETSMNDTLRIDSREAEQESPVHHPAPDCPVHVWVGGDERPAFIDQARWLSASWDMPLTVEPGRHHFDVIDGLADAASPLARALLS